MFSSKQTSHQIVWQKRERTCTQTFFRCFSVAEKIRWWLCSDFTDILFYQKFSKSRRQYNNIRYVRWTFSVFLKKWAWYTLCQLNVRWHFIWGCLFSVSNTTPSKDNSNLTSLTLALHTAIGDHWLWNRYYVKFNRCLPCPIHLTCELCSRGYF